MQTQDIIRVLQSSDRLQIKKGKTLIYAGYVASMEHTDIEEEILSAEVKRFQAVPEIRHKEWQKRGLMKPLQPEETPEYNFSDLQMSIYHTITIQGSESMAEMKVEVHVLDMPEVKAILERYKKINKRRDWVGKTRTGKGRKRTWKQ